MRGTRNCPCEAAVRPVCATEKGRNHLPGEIKAGGPNLPPVLAPKPGSIILQEKALPLFRRPDGHT